MAIRNLILEAYDQAIAELERLRGEVERTLPYPSCANPEDLRQMARITMRTVSATDLIFNSIAETANLPQPKPDYVLVAIDGNLDFELREKAEHYDRQELEWSRAKARSFKRGRCGVRTMAEKTDNPYAPPFVTSKAETKHTRGPWVYVPETGQYSGGIVKVSGSDAPSEEITIVMGSNYGAWRDAADNGDAEFAANGRLIAAAPDLLDALMPFAVGEDFWAPSVWAGFDDEQPVLHNSSSGQTITLGDFRRALSAIRRATEGK